jgi:hypothetical protein
VQLQANDAENNLQAITVYWGDGKSDTQNATNGITLTFTHIYPNAGTFTWSSNALDSGYANSAPFIKLVNVLSSTYVSSGYTKISNSGTTLPDTAVLGIGLNDWACTKDNKTGLIWEVKTSDGGLRDMNKGYTNYLQETGSNLDSNSEGFVKTVNTLNLCGSNNWRMPTQNELISLVQCQDGEYNKLGLATGYICKNYIGNPQPAINTFYFINTPVDSIYWSSMPNTGISLNNGFSYYQWHVSFKAAYSFDSYDSKSFAYNIRLVHDSQSPTTSAYTKISNTGVALPDTAVLGSGSNDWACTKDNKTGLTWEVKTDDGGLRDKDWYYSWYQPNGDNGGSVGYTDTTYTTLNCSTKDNCNTYAYTNAVNAQGLCGKNDWRMPTKDELKTLVYCSDGEYDADGSCINYETVTNPTINSVYFPNTQSFYWSLSPDANGSSNAWYVYFANGGSGSINKYYNNFVRLVR